jgi:hypothetical protein
MKVARKHTGQIQQKQKMLDKEHKCRKRCRVYAAHAQHSLLRLTHHRFCQEFCSKERNKEQAFGKEWYD